MIDGKTFAYYRGTAGGRKAIAATKGRIKARLKHREPIRRPDLIALAARNSGELAHWIVFEHLEYLCDERVAYLQKTIVDGRAYFQLA